MYAIRSYYADGQKIVDEFSTLINPERRVPPFITSLTGITNEMLEDAPKFYEIASKIVEITRDTVFVGHNVNFDYGFVKQEFVITSYSIHYTKLYEISFTQFICFCTARK